MNEIGVIEGFFGPQWADSARKSYAEFLSRYGGNFYIYAPKQDPFLRKEWRRPWSDKFIGHIAVLANKFHFHGVKFGVGFSPFGLGLTLSEEDKGLIREKISTLQSLGVDLIGLFFDDMPASDNLAETQIEVLHVVRECFQGRIIFCPSYYTPDPILDKVFGKRPDHYLEKIAEGLPSDVSIAWTGPKVISPEISADHLIETTALLKRRPFIWENLYANDGPKNCKFLKLRPFSGRSRESFLNTEAFGFNLMNQPELSKILYLSSKFVLKDELTPDAAFEKAISELCTKGFATFLIKQKEAFLNQGLDSISENDRENLLQELSGFKDPASKEIYDWLMGFYIVGPECLTD
jgi:hyaluronoglucosaminidase